MSQKIIVKVATDGSTEISTKGYLGPLCKRASEFIRKALGSKRSEKLTTDYFKSTCDAHSTINQGNSNES